MAGDRKGIKGNIENEPYRTLSYVDGLTLLKLAF